MELNDHILIDDFLNGNLSGAALDEFNARMENDADFKGEVEVQELANLVIVNNERMNIKAQLQQIHKERTNSSSNGRKWWGLGLVMVAVGILVSVWLVNQNDSIEVVAQDQENKALIKDILETNPDRNFDVENKEIVTPIATEEEPLVEKDAIEDLGLAEKNNKIKTENEPDKIVDQIEPAEKTIPIISEEIPVDIIVETNVDTIQDPCLGVDQVSPNYQLIKPCIGGKEGEIIFDDLAGKEVLFSEFSIDGGESYHSSMEKMELSIGNYQVVAKNNLGCISKMKSVEVTYADCNFVIQPNYDKYWEIEVPELNEQVTIEIRNARTGVMVYQKNLAAFEKFIWQGNDLNNNQLTMGNYVYWFKSDKKGVFSKGQITLVR
jgi:hypothetical protein